MSGIIVVVKCLDSFGFIFVFYLKKGLYYLRCIFYRVVVSIIKSIFKKL